MLRATLVLVATVMTTAAVHAGPSVARFQSVLGDFEVLLDPEAAPISVTNFASYANRGDYDSTFIHRSTTYDPSDIQIVQGGGFGLAGNSINVVLTDPPIPLEAGLTNSRGTLAMARTSDPDSATSQWYFNVQSNPALDSNYAVFGRVIGTGMTVVDAIGAVDVYDASGALGPSFSQLPLFAPSLVPENLVLIDSVRVEPFAITNITRIGNTTELRWTALSTNTPIRVERTTNLDGAPWTAIATNLTSGSFTDTNPPSGSAFYRLVTEP